MNKSQHSDEHSFLNDSNPNILAPITTQGPTQRNPLLNQHTKQTHKTTNSVINILKSNRNTGKLEFNDQLIDYLYEDENNSNLNVATFVGPKQVGKSFLVDFIISKEERSSSRFLSKNPQPLINIPTYEVRGKNGQKIIFFDCHEDLPNDAFLWTYFFTSVYVLNLVEGDRKGQEQFLAKLQHVRISLESEPDDMSLPQLIILRRDATSKDFQDRQFISKIQRFGLFASDIKTLNMAYPGGHAKDIKDVGQNLLTPAFLNDVQQLTYEIKGGRPKTMKGNYVGSKIAGLALEPVTQSINKTGKIQINKIWGDVIETLSVGYYNHYMKRYSEQLRNEFADEQPSDKYTLYKRLSKIRRNVDRKFQGFNMIAGDATFQRYREKVLENIGKKQKVIKEINKRKSIEKNDQLCKKLFSRMNDNNCEELIQQYCNSKLDDNKTEVLLANFQTAIKRRLSEVQKSKNPALKPSTEVIKLENEMRQLEQKIRQQKQNKVEIIEYDIATVKANIERKEKEVKQMEQQLQKQKKISSQKRSAQNKDIVQLQNKIQTLRSTTRQQENQIEKLKVARQAQTKQTVQKLNRKLKQEEQRYRRLQQQVRKAQELSALNQKSTKPQSKDTCCSVM